jgi:cation:H+ antiporter
LVVGVLLAGLEPEEMLTAAIASARGAPALAVGNVIGTNVTMLTAALGLSALIFPMVIDRSVRRQAVIATLVSGIPVALLFLGMVTQLEGILLLVVFVGYTLFLFRTDREAVKRLAESEDDDDHGDLESRARPRLHWKAVLLTFGGKEQQDATTSISARTGPNAQRSHISAREPFGLHYPGSSEHHPLRPGVA